MRDRKLMHLKDAECLPVRCRQPQEGILCPKYTVWLLTFSGGPESWFDLWHTHVDWDGKGNRDWATRKKYLKLLRGTFDKLKLELKRYPHDFQLRIVIDENDSGGLCLPSYQKS